MAGGEYHEPAGVKAVVRSFAQAMRRGDGHPSGDAGYPGCWYGQHRLAAIIEAERPVELTVFTEVGEGT